MNYTQAGGYVGVSTRVLVACPTHSFRVLSKRASPLYIHQQGVTDFQAVTEAAKAPEESSGFYSTGRARSNSLGLCLGPLYSTSRARSNSLGLCLGPPSMEASYLPPFMGHYAPRPPLSQTSASLLHPTSPRFPCSSSASLRKFLLWPLKYHSSWASFWLPHLQAYRTWTLAGFITTDKRALMCLYKIRNAS
jgi:hypothetical protein